MSADTTDTPAYRLASKLVRAELDRANAGRQAGNHGRTHAEQRTRAALDALAAVAADVLYLCATPHAAIMATRSALAQGPDTRGHNGATYDRDALAAVAADALERMGWSDPGATLSDWCAANSDHGNGYTCTREAGHDGDHAAHATFPVGTVQVATWSDPTPVESPTPDGPGYWNRCTPRERAVILARTGETIARGARAVVDLDDPDAARIMGEIDAASDREADERDACREHVDTGACCECGDTGHGCQACPVFDGPAVCPTCAGWGVLHHDTLAAATCPTCEDGNAGCDRCGTYDRAPGSLYCPECADAARVQGWDA